MVFQDFRDHSLDIPQVIDNCLLPAKLGHPACDDVLVCSIVEPMQRLYGGHQPCCCTGDPFKLTQMHVGVFPVTMEADEKRVGPFGVGEA